MIKTAKISASFGARLGRTAFAACLFAVALGTGAFAARAEASAETDVLIVGSYDPLDRWTTSLLAGLKEGLAEVSNLRLWIEYLDARRKPGKAHCEIFQKALREKYRDTPPGLLVAFDDEAFEVALALRRELGTQPPVVFCGLNNFDPKAYSDLSGVAGVVEAVDVAGTVNAGLRLFPYADKLLVVAGSAGVGARNVRVFNEVRGLFIREIAVDVVFDLQETAVDAALSGVGPSTLILRLDNLRRRDGSSLPLGESMRRMRRAARGPILTLWDFDLGQGALGGLVVSGKQQGELAAGLVRTMLANPGESPPILRPAGTPLFDFAEFERFGLDAGAVPAGSTFINRPSSFYERHGSTLFWGGGVIVVLGVLVALLSWALWVRRRAQDALCKSEEFQRLLAEQAPISVMAFDETGAVTFVNDWHMLVFAREVVEKQYYLGRKIWDLSVIRQAGLSGRIKTVLSGGDLFVEELFVPRFIGGHSGWISLRCTPLVREGRVLGGVMLREDITERKETAIELAKSEARFRNFLETAAEGVLSADEHGKPLFVNQVMADMLGLSTAQVFEHTLNDFIFSKDFPAHLKKMEERKRGVRERYERRLRRMGGGEVWTMISASPIMDEQGVFRGTFGMFADITELKAAQAALLEAKNAAEAASKAKSEFLANISHEIRTPLNGVLGMLQLLQRMDLNDESKPLVETALDSSRRLTQLLNDILDLSRIEAGRLLLCEAPFSPTDFRDSVLGLFSHAAEAKGLSFGFEIGSGVPDGLLGDEARLRQILFNVVGNAVKFTDRGEVSIEAHRVFTRADGRVQMLFIVRDTGIGAPDWLLESIFEPFTQADGSHVRRYGGAGLGLAIVKRLTLLMGGEAAFESEDGKGTTVYVSLPFMPAAACWKRPQTVTAVEAKRPLSILLVEDDRINRLAVGRMLEKAGHRVKTAENGLLAVEVLESERFDCVLMDIQMPVMDGMEAARAIRNLEREKGLPTAPIIALTAHAMTGDRERFLAAGMTDYLAKPVEVNALLEAVAAAVDDPVEEPREGC